MHNFILTNVVFFSTIAAEFLFNFYQKTGSHLAIDKFIGLFVILYVFSFIKSTFWRRTSMNFILVLSFFQMMHLQFYGMPVYPNAIYLLFADTGEVTDVLLQEFALFIIPLLIVTPLLALNLFTDKKAFKLKKIKFLHFLFIFYFIYNPTRTYITGNTWGRQPSTQEFMGMNIYLSLSYFFGRLLPYKLSDQKDNSAPKLNIQFTKSIPKDMNIIFVLGESLSANHLSLFEYKRQTTPYLESLKTDSNFIYRRGISSGVSTDVAVAMLMNNTFGLRGNEDVIKGEKCLFKLAKENGFVTHFYSSQSTQQLRYISNSICQKYIENYKDLNTIEPNLPNENMADDSKTIDQITDGLNGAKNHFIILHQRGAHSPYNLRYRPQNTIFELTDDYQTDRVNHYDNAVYDFDLFMQKLISKVKTFPKKTLIVYSSDHGEGLGEEGVWGHAALKRPSIDIPVLFYTHMANGLNEELKKLPENPTHLNISLIISSLLGYESDLDIYTIPKNYTILANDIDGFAGYLETKFENGKLIAIERKDI